MKSADQAVEVSAQTTRTKFDGPLLTTRSRKSFFEVTQAIEKSLQRFHIPKLTEHVAHGDRAGVVSRLPARPPRHLVTVRCGD